MILTQKDVESILSKHIASELVEEFIKYYKKVKEAWALEKFPEFQFNSRKFLEIMTRILEYLSTKQFTPLDKSIPLGMNLINQLESNTNLNESIRVDFPKWLRTIDEHLCTIDAIRKKGYSDRNVDQDGLRFYIINACDWILDGLMKLDPNVGNVTERRDIIL